MIENIISGNCKIGHCAISENFDLDSMINCDPIMLNNCDHCIKESIPFSSSCICSLNYIHTLGGVLTQTLSLMVTFVFWNELTTYKILAVILCIYAISMFIMNESAFNTGLYDWSKSIPLILELPFVQWHATNFYASEQSPSLILGEMSEGRNFVPSGRDFIGMGSERRLTFSFLSYLTKRASLQNCLWGPPKESPIFFGVGGLFWRRNSRCETTGLTWSNLERIYSRSVLWYLFLLHKLILILDLPRGVWWRLSSSSTPWAVIGSSPLIATIHTFLLACDGSWWPAG